MPCARSCWSAAGATYSTARDEAGALFDYQLKQIALSLRDQTFRGSAEALAGDESLDYVIRVWDQTGLTVYYSRPHESLPELTQLGYSTADTREGAWRVFAIQYHGLTIAVAQPMRVRNRLAAGAAWSTLKPFFIFVAGAGSDHLGPRRPGPAAAGAAGAVGASAYARFARTAA